MVSLHLQFDTAEKDKNTSASLKQNQYSYKTIWNGYLKFKSLHNFMIYGLPVYETWINREKYEYF